MLQTLFYFVIVGVLQHSFLCNIIFQELYIICYGLAAECVPSKVCIGGVVLTCWYWDTMKTLSQGQTGSLRSTEHMLLGETVRPQSLSDFLPCYVTSSSCMYSCHPPLCLSSKPVLYCLNFWPPEM